MSVITSASNPRIKQARALRGGKERRRNGLYLVEGLRHLGEALDAAVPLEYVLYAADGLTSEFGQSLLAGWEARGTPCYAASLPLMEKLSSRDSAPGILAVARQVWTPLETLNPENFPWGVVLHAPQDPGNLGTIMRTLDAAGASGLILLGGGVDPFHPTAVRASLGALFWHPVAAASSADFLTWAENTPYTIYGSSAHGNQPIAGLARFEFPALLLLGSERKGLTPALKAHCHKILQIPMAGKVTSLNLAVAAGILLYKMAERDSGGQDDTIEQ